MSAARVNEEVKEKVDELQGQAKKAVRKASPWIIGLGRFGLAAKGVVYVIIGWLALQPAIHGGGRPTDQRGALLSILEKPFGALMLGVLAAGLLGYMVWRIVEALLNPERHENNFKGWSKRALHFGSGVIYGGLALAAIRLAVGLRSKRNTPEDWTAMAMSKPFGKWLVVAVGIGIAAAGLMMIWKAFTGDLKARLVLDRYAAPARQWILRLGRVGRAARGVVFAIIGTFVFFAGLQTNPSKAKGLAEALGMIEGAPYGPYLLGTVAAGLIAYGLFQFVEARYRRIQPQ